VHPLRAAHRGKFLSHRWGPDMCRVPRRADGEAEAQSVTRRASEVQRMQAAH
jgi:hypothetical protein